MQVFGLPCPANEQPVEAPQLWAFIRSSSSADVSQHQSGPVTPDEQPPESSQL